MILNNQKFIKIFEKYMFIVGLLGQLVFYLQAYEIFYKQNAGDVSFIAFLFGFFSVLSWLIYGIVIKNSILIFANTFAVIGALAVLTAILMYGT